MNLYCSSKNANLQLVLKYEVVAFELPQKNTKSKYIYIYIYAFVFGIKIKKKFCLLLFFDCILKSESIT